MSQKTSPATDSSPLDTPERVVDRLQDLYADAIGALRASLDHFVSTGVPPTSEERARFRYPELKLSWQPEGANPGSRRAYAKFSTPGDYVTTVTQPDAFRPYLIDQLRPLMLEYGAVADVRPGTQEIPYPYALDGGDELARGGLTAAELARHFPTPLLSTVGDEIADGTFRLDGRTRPLALFDAVRTDFSLRRLEHYTGTPVRAIQPWILLTNYHRYVDQFIRFGVEAIRAGGPYFKLIAPGGIEIDASNADEAAIARIAASPWHRFQMPAYHLVTADRQGITLVNIGVGPSNAKNITDHLAVLRPHCWLMIGHCGGLRDAQLIGDYVLAHAYLRQDHILDDILPPEIPIPALAEIQIALHDAAERITGETGETLKRRLRTGTVVTQDDRNWELRWTKERFRINLSRAIAVDMESGTIAAQGYRLRVPYGTLLCVSDKPLHGEIKLPGAANAFYQRAVGEHLQIGIATLEALKGIGTSLHSRKLRAFDEPPFR